MKWLASISVALLALVHAAAAKEAAPSAPCDALVGHAYQAVHGVVYSPDGDRVAVLTPLGVEVRSVCTLEIVQLLYRVSERASAEGAVWSGDGRTLAVLYHDGDVVLWDVVRGAATSTLAIAHNEGLVWLSWDGSLLAFSGLDISHGLLCPDKSARDASASDLACISLMSVFLLDTRTGSITGRLRDASLWSQCHSCDQWYGMAVAASPSQTLVAAGTYTATCVWDLQTGALLRTLPQDVEPEAKGAACEVFLSAGGTQLACRCARTITFWSVATGELVATATLPEWDDGSIFSPVILSPDFRWAAVQVSGGTVRLCDTATWTTVCEFGGGEEPPALAFSPDGLSIAWGEDDGHVIVWRIPGAET